MRALTVIPGRSGSAELSDLPEPAPEVGDLLIEARAVGICGTDRDILEGRYGVAPPGEERLVLGHESVGRVLEAPAGSGLLPRDWVAGMVRRPDPVPCASCAAGEWDMCENGLYLEHGIKGLHGFASERYRLSPERVVKLDPGLAELGVLLEPTSVVAKAWDHIDRIAARTRWRPRRVLVTGAGPIGLLGALLARLRNLEVHVLDRSREGPKPGLVQDLGATYHTDGLERMAATADVILECTGAPAVIFPAIAAAGRNAIVCLTGLSSGRHAIQVDAAQLNRMLVLENNVVFGSVNANRGHYRLAAAALARAGRGWLARLVTRRVPLARWPDALVREPGDVKVVITFGTRL